MGVAPLGDRDVNETLGMIRIINTMPPSEGDRLLPQRKSERTNRVANDFAVAPRTGTSMIA